MSGAHEETITWCLFVDPDCRTEALTTWTATLCSLRYLPSEGSSCWSSVSVGWWQFEGKGHGFCVKPPFAAQGFGANESINLFSIPSVAPEVCLFEVSGINLGWDINHTKRLWNWIFKLYAHNPSARDYPWILLNIQLKWFNNQMNNQLSTFFFPHKHWLN